MFQRMLQSIDSAKVFSLSAGGGHVNSMLTVAKRLADRRPCRKNLGLADEYYARAAAGSSEGVIWQAQIQRELRSGDRERIKS
jgi:hypothetical protein